jgi:formate dehydrogenase major subunit
LNTPADHSTDTELSIDGALVPGYSGELLIDLLNRWRDAQRQKPIPQVCYVPRMGPIESCDTCIVKVNGQLARSCATRVVAGMQVETDDEIVDIAQREAFDRILQNHMLYCTVCDNNNQNCTIHNTEGILDVKHQTRPFTPKPYDKDMSNPFYRYDPDQCILCCRCVESCQNVQVNETLSINWESDHPRVLWDGGTIVTRDDVASSWAVNAYLNNRFEQNLLGRQRHKKIAVSPLLSLSIGTLEKLMDILGKMSLDVVLEQRFKKNPTLTWPFDAASK